MNQAMRAVIQRFPEMGPAIRSLAERSESFRDLCQDLADAELALERWAASSSTGSQVRCGEYRALVDELGTEIKKLLETEKRFGSGMKGNDS